MEVTLKAQPRSATGKGAARKARQAGEVPGVVYGIGIDPIPLSISTREMSSALHTEAGTNVLINLQLDSKTKYFTMLREVQQDPLRGSLIHVDFLKIDRDVKIEADVPIHIVGESHGVREGGVVEHHLWEVRVEALPTDVPPNLEIDITALGIGEHLRVSDLRPPSDVEILSPAEEIVVSVVEPQVIKLPEEEAAEAAAAEAALAAAEAGEELPEGAEAAEGAEAGGEKAEGSTGTAASE